MFDIKAPTGKIEVSAAKRLMRTQFRVPEGCEFPLLVNSSTIEGMDIDEERLKKVFRINKINYWAMSNLSIVSTVIHRVYLQHLLDHGEVDKTYEEFLQQKQPHAYQRVIEARSGERHDTKP